jgi:hypothetical protein
MTRRYLVLAGKLLTLALIAAGIYLGNKILNKSRAKITMVHMRRIESLLLLSQPRFVDEAYVRHLLAGRGQERYLFDGWQHPIQVEVEVDREGQPYYRVVSLGRDGRRGACCRRFAGFDWDADAVLMNQEWLQVWR